MGFVICGEPVAGVDGSFADTPLALHPIIVSPARTEDLPALASLHRAAFHGSPHKLVMFPNVKNEGKLLHLARVRVEIKRLIAPPFAEYEAWNVNRMTKWLAPENESKHWTVVAKRGDVVLGFGHYVLDERVEGAEEEKHELPSFPEGTDVEAAKYLFEVIGNSEKEIQGKYISECLSQLQLELRAVLTRRSSQCFINLLPTPRIKRLERDVLSYNGVSICIVVSELISISMLRRVSVFALLRSFR